MKKVRSGKVIKRRNSFGEVVRYKIIKYETSKHTEEFDDFVEQIKRHPFFYNFKINSFQNGELRTIIKVPNKIKLTEGLIVKLYNSKIGYITLHPNNDGTVELYRLEIFEQNKGYGTKILEIFNKISCEIDVVISLLVGDPSCVKWNITNEDRTRFYSNNGFTRTKGLRMNGYVERFNRTFREDVLDMNIFENIHQVKEKTEEFLEDYNNEHPHDSLGNMSPIEFMNSRNQKKSA